MTNILESAEKLFKQRGYYDVTLEDVAADANLPLPGLQKQYADKQDILYALLERHSPRQLLKKTLYQLKGDSAETLAREAFWQLIAVMEEHPIFMEYALLDVQVNNASYLTGLMTELAGEMVGFINRLSKMPEMRPISSVMLGRAFASLLIGFVATEQFAPRSARFAMRMFPQKAWVQGMVDIFLYGILESE